MLRKKTICFNGEMSIETEEYFKAKNKSFYKKGIDLGNRAKVSFWKETLCPKNFLIVNLRQ